MSRKTLNRPGARGFTLLELMVAGALGMVLVAAATTVFLLQRKLYQQSERKLDVHRDLTIAAALIERDLEDVGYKWPAAAFAVRINDNTVGGTNLGNGDLTNTTVVPGIGSGSEGIIGGTDVLDIWLGNPSAIAGTVLGLPAGVVTNITVNLTSLDPFTATDVAFLQASPGVNFGPLLLFTDASGVIACLAMTTRYVQTVPTVQIQARLVDGNLGTVTAPNGTCPAANMSVYALVDRHRYMVYQMAGGVDLGLYEEKMVDPAHGQRAGILGSSMSGTPTTPTFLVGGIEDMQVSWRVNNPLNVLGCGTPLCFCLAQLAADCDPTLYPTQVRGARVDLVSRGENGTTSALSDIAVLSGGQRPQVFNHTGGAIDNIYRDQLLTSVWFRNLGLVKP